MKRELFSRSLNLQRNGPFWASFFILYFVAWSNPCQAVDGDIFRLSYPDFAVTKPHDWRFHSPEESLLDVGTVYKNKTLNEIHLKRLEDKVEKIKNNSTIWIPKIGKFQESYSGVNSTFNVNFNEKGALKSPVKILQSYLLLHREELIDFEFHGNNLIEFEIFGQPAIFGKFSNIYQLNSGERFKETHTYWIINYDEQHYFTFLTTCPAESCSQYTEQFSDILASISIRGVKINQEKLEKLKKLW
ncbi:MAG: hypothetical protein G3M70_10850 [Candidatus Nitronauta litoralis]|uniref:Uncharacterized protein n=1 Tax=Candidatus Nitronauta litoralis TaxID=2705533 RepID=A0A7T0G0I6_9BACT|nr:MAG: hypothetical protein G3M70_10850 [Candidatus Nitronauta litoralis]